ncbi:hypothetical protein O181_011073 [Austropuccinia psidii MF-1]|uniref:glucan 1,3-beta-glucosidase n=1 Tax=Austropuccinia psidii MF-1 TaxID=1389203 RepID=A0A9Q3BUK1_9BASI|nr:hypothetical protein [Austropuccinia psidii MF-1]
MQASYRDSTMDSNFDGDLQTNSNYYGELGIDSFLGTLNTISGDWENSMAGLDFQESSIAGSDLQENSISGLDFQESSIAGLDFQESSSRVQPGLSVDPPLSQRVHFLSRNLSASQSDLTTSSNSDFSAIESNQPTSIINTKLLDGVTTEESSEAYKDQTRDPPQQRLKKQSSFKRKQNFSEKIRKNRKRIIIFSILVIIILAAVIASTIWLKSPGRQRKVNDKHSAVNFPANQKLWGVGGDEIITNKGKKFIYNNTLGGTWVAIPYNDSARPQGDQPALNERWDYSSDRILGVNLGGWLVIEPFITPSLFEPYLENQKPVTDEWELSQALGTSLASTIESHYDNFITEEDFAQIASAGLNWVRLPVGWWMIETLGDEPFLEGVSWKYFFRALGWARKYGLRINLDLHAVPGSQNGWNHSGRSGTVGFLAGAMGIANAQRTLNYVRTLAQFISQPEYKNVVPMFSILNEPFLESISRQAITSWYYQAYRIVREIGGYGEGKGPFVVIHDGFEGLGKTSWAGFMKGSDRIALDSHNYWCFTAQVNDPMQTNAFKPCNGWAARSNETMQTFGLAMIAEWSVAVNDCGLFVNGVNKGSRYEGTFPNPNRPNSEFQRVGSCTEWLDHRTWSQDRKKGFADMAQASQDAAINSFFWTWKIGDSIKQNFPPNPMWSYKVGLQAGFIRPDARGSRGVCSQLSSQFQMPLKTYQWSGRLAPWKTGEIANDTINQDQMEAVKSFPPPTILGGAPNGQGRYNTTLLPQLAATGPAKILKPIPIVIGNKTYAGGNGWFNQNDKAGYFAPISGCQYLDPWAGVNAVAPPPCAAL